MSSSSRRSHYLARLLRRLIVGTIVVSGACCLHHFVNHGAARFTNEAAMDTTADSHVDGRARSVWFCNGWVPSPKAVRLHTDLAAPTIHISQAFFSRRVFRGNFAATFLLPVMRGSLPDAGTQACSPAWYIHEASVVFYAAHSSSEYRYGVGKNKGGGEGASRRETKGELFWRRGGKSE